MNKPATIHTLNAVRVLAEYVVVHYHVSEGFQVRSLLGATMASHVMSFFFVLSGFMAMHCNMHTDFSDGCNAKQYIWTRFRKTFPTYLFFYLMGLPGSVLDWHEKGCDLRLLSLASQPVLISPWLGLFHIGQSNPVSWYICTLYWMWTAFPFIPCKTIFACHPWPKLFALYITSIGMWVMLARFYTEHTRSVPVFRTFEFFMGVAVAFTLEHKVHGCMVIVGLMGFVAFCVSDFFGPESWKAPSLSGSCMLWEKTNKLWEKTNETMVAPTVVLSLFSGVWALLIHWLAATELKAEASIMVKCLSFDMFKTLSTFSLEIYLSHFVFTSFVMTIFRPIGALGLWDPALMILACYAFAYAFNVWAQPVLNTIWDWIFASTKPQGDTNTVTLDVR